MLATWTLLGVIGSTLCIILARWALRRRQALRLFQKHGIRGPVPSFICGNMLELYEEHPNTAISHWIQQYGDVFGFYVGEKPHMVINDLDILKQVLIKDYQVFMNRPKLFLDLDPLHLTMALQQDVRWKEIRSILSPTFSSGKIKLMSNIVSGKVDITVRVINKMAEKKEMFDIYEVFQGLTLDVIAACALAMKSDCQENENDPLLKSARMLIQSLNNPAAKLALIFTFIASVMKVAAKFMTVGQMIKNIITDINRVLNYRCENPEVRSADFLQLMLDRQAESAKEGIPVMTNKEIAVNAAMFLIAGYETTSTAMAFTFYALVTHPEIQERLYKEVSQAEDSSYESIQNCQYLDQVFNEALRLYPPVTQFITRNCSKDYQVGTLMVPKDVVILSPVWNIQHNPTYWPDPWTFDPDRFSPENKHKINSMAFQAFGAGPRNCIGSRFALLEAKHAIFSLLRKFKFETCERTEEKLSIRNHPLLSQPANGVWVRAVLRESI